MPKQWHKRYVSESIDAANLVKKSIYNIIPKFKISLAQKSNCLLQDYGDHCLLPTVGHLDSLQIVTNLFLFYPRHPLPVSTPTPTSRTMPTLSDNLPLSSLPTSPKMLEKKMCWKPKMFEKNVLTGTRLTYYIFRLQKCAESLKCLQKCAEKPKILLIPNKSKGQM